MGLLLEHVIHHSRSGLAIYLAGNLNIKENRGFAKFPGCSSTSDLALLVDQNCSMSRILNEWKTC